jgi:hypothetical protein
MEITEEMLIARMNQTKQDALIESMQAPNVYVETPDGLKGLVIKEPERPPVTDAPVERGDRVEELGVFGAETGEKGTVLAADDTQAVVKWDDDGRELLRQRYLTKTYAKA